MFEFSGLVLVVTGLVEVAKYTGLSSRYAPILAIVVGLILSFIANSDVVGYGLPQIAMTGLVIGLTASGFYSAAKTVVLNK